MVQEWDGHISGRATQSLRAERMDHLKRFDRFRTASGLKKQPDPDQISTLIYCMGPEAEDVFAMFNDALYGDVTQKFEDQASSPNGTSFTKRSGLDLVFKENMKALSLLLPASTHYRIIVNSKIEEIRKF